MERVLPVIRRVNVSLGPDGSVINHNLIIPDSFKCVLKGVNKATILYHSKDHSFLGVQIPDKKKV